MINNTEAIMAIDKAPISKLRMTYDEAVMYCLFLMYDGRTDWRLPTANEIDGHAMFVWIQDDDTNRSLKWHVQPVRTR